MCAIGTLAEPVTDTDQQLRLMQENNNQTHEPGTTLETRQDGGFWYGSIKHGDMPFAPDGYMMFRDVVKDFGAVGDGVADDTVAINRASAWLSDVNSDERCGKDCGQTTKTGAVVYFPVCMSLFFRAAILLPTYLGVFSPSKLLGCCHSS
jgi:glucan 1,3-beta-glucosidase